MKDEPMSIAQPHLPNGQSKEVSSLSRAKNTTDIKLVTLTEAALAVGKSAHNIRDYIQRGRIAKYNPEGKKIRYAKNGGLRVDLNELQAFLRLVNEGQEKHHHAGL